MTQIRTKNQKPSSETGKEKQQRSTPEEKARVEQLKEKIIDKIGQKPDQSATILSAWLKKPKKNQKEAA